MEGFIGRELIEKDVRRLASKAVAVQKEEIR